MHVHIVVDVDWWSFRMHAEMMRKALVKRGISCTVGKGEPEVLTDRPVAVILSSWHQLDQLGPLPRPEQARQLFVGIRSYHGLRQPGLKRWIPVLRKAGGVFACNPDLAQQAANVIGREVAYLPDGMDTERYTMTQDKAPREFVVGWSGNADLPEKRFDLAVKACELAGVTFRPVGRGRGLKRLALAEMPAYFRTLSLYLCTSNEDGTPNGPLEAAACGVPVLSAEVGVMPEFLQGHGQLLPLESGAERWADVILSWADMDDETMRQERRDARAAAERWSWDNQIEGYLAMIEGPLPVQVFAPASKVRPVASKGETKAADNRPLACLALMRCMYVDDAATEAAVWRLVPRKSGRFRWTLAPSPPLASVDWARSKLLSDCLRKTEAEVFVMQDGDMGVNLHDYEHLAAHALDRGDGVIMGSMLCKRGGGGFCGIVDLVGHFGDKETDTFPIHADLQAKLDDHEYNGAALTAYPRKVLERIAAELPWAIPHGTNPDNAEHCETDGFWPFFMPELRPAQLAFSPPSCKGSVVYMTEDRAFCDVARGRLPPIFSAEGRQGEHREQIWISLKPKVAHWGSFGWLPEHACMPPEGGE
jgi:hypothetical protein